MSTSPVSSSPNPASKPVVCYTEQLIQKNKQFWIDKIVALSKSSKTLAYITAPLAALIIGVVRVVVTPFLALEIFFKILKQSGEVILSKEKAQQAINSAKQNLKNRSLNLDKSSVELFYKAQLAALARSTPTTLRVKTALGLITFPLYFAANATGLLVRAIVDIPINSHEIIKEMARRIETEPKRELQPKQGDLQSKPKET